MSLNSLNSELRTFYKARQQQIPAAVREIMQRAGEELAMSGQTDRALTHAARRPLTSRCPRPPAIPSP